MTPRPQNYLALDLELNQSPNGPPRIIQVGVAIGNLYSDPKDYTIHSWFINPNEPITPFITELTGITDSDVINSGVSYQQLVADLTALVTEHQTFTNPVTWGQGDASELLSEIRTAGITGHLPFFGRRIIDIKTIFVFNQFAQGLPPSGGLRSAMGRYGLQFQGLPHRAYTDAANTLRLFFELLARQSQLESIVCTCKSIKQ